MIIEFEQVFNTILIAKTKVGTVTFRAGYRNFTKENASTDFKERVNAYLAKRPETGKNLLNYPSFIDL